jgi:hypothetical protein
LLRFYSMFGATVTVQPCNRLAVLMAAEIGQQRPVAMELGREAVSGCCRERPTRCACA